MTGPFAEVALLLLICAFAGAVFVRLRQPVLLFAVGLNLDLHHVRHFGPVTVATRLG
jgi:Kef-type K+ transport system membrane component KefB